MGKSETRALIVRARTDCRADLQARLDADSGGLRPGLPRAAIARLEGEVGRALTAEESAIYGRVWEEYAEECERAGNLVRV